MGKNTKHKREPVSNHAAEPEKAAPKTFLDKVNIQVLIVFLLAFGIYANTIPNFYVQDDVPAITENKLVQQGVQGIPAIFKHGFIYGLTGSDEGTYRPISLFTFAIEHSIWGNNPHLSHLVNVLLFALSCTLLLLTLRLMLGEKGGLIAFVITLLYAAHPIHTEAVSNIKSRDEVFCFLFALMSLYSLLKFTDAEGNSSKRISWGAIGVISFFLSILSKESSLPFVIIIPLTIYYFRNITLKKLVPAGLLVIASAAAYLGLRYMIFKDVINIHGEIQKTDNIMAHLPYLERIATAFAVIGKYLLLMIFPNPLSYDYSFNQIPRYHWGDYQFFLPFLLSLGALIYYAVRLPKKELPGYGIFFFFLSISVVANIFLLIGSAMGERFMYIPSLGFCILLGYILVKYMFRADKKGVGFAIGWALTGLIVLLYSAKTISRNMDWKDNFTLYSVDVKHAPKSARTHYSIGTELNVRAKNVKDPEKKKEMLHAAEAELLKALEINPEYPDAIINIGNVYHELGQYDKEMEYLSKVQTDTKGASEVLYNSGNALLAKEDYRGAINNYLHSIEAKPDFAQPYVNLASAYSSINMPDSAIFYLEKAISLDPSISQAYINLGSAYSAKGELKKAIELYHKAIKLDAKSAEAYINLGSADINSGNIPEAIVMLKKAIELKPEIPEGYYNLGYAYQLQKNYSLAIQMYKKAASLRPAYKDAYMNLGFCALTLKNYQESIDYYQEVLKYSPNEINAYLSLAFLYKKTGNMPKALEYKRMGDALKPH